MRGLLVPFGADPVRVSLRAGEEGTLLADLQDLVGGDIEPFDVLFDEGITLYVNADGLGTEPPNRAIYATKSMEEEGYLSQIDFAHVAREGELYTILCGPIVAVGIDRETGEHRSLTSAEQAMVTDYFTRVSPAMSGLYEAARIREQTRGRASQRENPPLEAPQRSQEPPRETEDSWDLGR